MNSPLIRKLPVFLMLVLLSCRNDDDEPQLATIQGYVTHQSQPVVGAFVRVLGNQDIRFRTAQTDSKGFYEITDLPPGVHEIGTGTSFGDAGFSNSGARLDLEKGVTKKDFAIAKPVGLSVHVNRYATDNEVILTWTTFTGKLLGEYEVIKSGNAEANGGFLIYSGNETSFKTTVPHNSKWYFRVSVKGKSFIAGSNYLSGSNVVTVEVGAP